MKRLTRIAPTTAALRAGLAALALVLAGCAAHVQQSKRTEGYDRQPTSLNVRWEMPASQSIRVTKSAQYVAPKIDAADQAAAQMAVSRHLADLRPRSVPLFRDELKPLGVALAEAADAQAELLISPSEIETNCTYRPCTSSISVKLTLFDRVANQQAWTGKIRIAAPYTSGSYDTMTRQTTTQRVDTTLEFVKAVVGELKRARIVGGGA
ncbi:MAG: hypothetical protein U1E89_20650 [Burkholderiaceae bacterium]